MDKKSLGAGWDDPEVLADSAGLVYVRDDQPGYCRCVRGRGFMYLDPDGAHVKDPDLKARFEALVIPPAWTDVWICADDRGHIQATGRDDAGRKQYIYHPDWSEASSLAKFSALVPFAEVLPLIRERYEAGLRKRTLGREKVLAVALRLLDETLIRVGNTSYARSNNSFGLTTLRDRHASFSDEGCVFLFTGKSGKEQRVLLDDARLARAVKECRDVPGYDLFQYYAEDGSRCTLSSTDVNNALREITGSAMTAKTFRTWGATVLAAVELHRAGPPESDKAADRQIVEMIKRVAEKLGNTVAVSRSYYVHPIIPETYRSGDLHRDWRKFARRKPIEGLEPVENFVLHLLREHEG